MGRARELAELATGYDAGALQFRNRIINGDMRIDQRNAGATISGGTGAYSVDRWNSAFAQAGKFNYGQSTTAPSGFTNSLLHTVAAAYTSGASDYFLVQHYIEGLNVADLAFGTASASTIAVSFKVRSSVTGTYSVAITNGADNRAYVTTFTVNSANTFEDKTVVIPGDTSGTWLTNNGKGISVKFDLGSGSNYVAASTNTWVSTNTFKASGSVSLVANSGATFYITGVQLEVGSVATPFERRPYGTELALCQRYLPAFTGTGFLGSGISSSTTSGEAFINFLTETRVAPTGISVSAGSDFSLNDRVSNFNASAVAFGSATTKSSNIVITTTGLTQYRTYYAIGLNSTSKLLFTGCEL